MRSIYLNVMVLKMMMKLKIELYSGQTFTSFDVLEQFLKRYATQIEFETKIVRVEKKDDVYAQKTYKCRHGGNQELLHQFALSLRKIPVNVKEEIHFLVQDCQLGATVLKRILRKKFSDQEIYHQDLYN
ncbi:hypothetical protein RIR_jg32992.t1 [Rhizophagus irregularis DAOM 181602=DAOM 197198]|nr:hypothetical protein RIR_jg32992.t1 [Rhizophagus irregularis DAOM 181602=DAOM 197198]CAB4488904.1 unnamed protein product [Rhizophagus irregularis]